MSMNTETFREIPPHKTPFVRVHIKNTDIFGEVLPNNTTHNFQSSYHITHFQGVTFKFYCTFSQSSYQTILTPPELLPNSTVK